MAWTTPGTFVAGVQALASWMNTNVRDNLSALWVGTAAGDTEYYSSATTKAKIAKGIAFAKYRMNSGATAPQWFSEIYCSVYRAANLSVNDATYTDVPFDTRDYDPDLMWSASSPTVITIPFTGLWLVTAKFQYDPDAGGTTRETRIYKNTIDFIANDSRLSASNASVFATINSPKILTAGDTVKLTAWQNSGGALNMTGGYTALSVLFMGPAP